MATDAADEPTTGPHAPRDAMFRIEFAVEDGGVVQVRRAEIARRDLRHDLTFTARRDLDAVLVPALARVVRRLVADRTEGPLPESIVTLPGLALGRPSAEWDEDDRGGPLLRLRFDYFVGGVQDAFALRTGFARPTLEHREAIGVMALEDVTMPLLNMATVGEAAMTGPQAIAAAAGGAAAGGAAEAVAAQLRAIEARAGELEFYADLLRRYVVDCAPGIAAPTAPPAGAGGLGRASEDARVSVPRSPSRF